MTGIILLFIELYIFVRSALKIWKRKPSELAITRYELAVVVSLERYSRAKWSFRLHILASLVIALVTYWIFFLDSDSSVVFLFALFIVFILAGSGFTRRKEMEVYIRDKRLILAEYKKAREQVDRLEEAMSERIRESIAHLDPNNMVRSHFVAIDAAGIEIRSHLSDAEVKVKELRFFSFGFLQNARRFRRRLMPSIEASVSNPIGLIAVFFSLAIFIGVARAQGILASRPWLVEYGSKSECARILVITDNGYFLEVANTKKTRVFLPVAEFRSAAFDAASCASL